MARSNGKPKTINVTEFKIEKGQSLSMRVAAFLDWAADKYPGIYTPYNQLVRAVMGYDYTPRMANKEVMDIRKKLSHTRGVLRDQYKREIVSEKDLGVRATFNDADALMVALPKKVARARSATAALQATVSLIDPAKVPDTEEFKPWKKWLKSDVREALKLASTIENAHLALPAHEAASK